MIGGFRASWTSFLAWNYRPDRIENRSHCIVVQRRSTASLSFRLPQEPGWEQTRPMRNKVLENKVSLYRLGGWKLFSFRKETSSPIASRGVGDMRTTFCGSRWPQSNTFRDSNWGSSVTTVHSWSISSWFGSYKTMSSTAGSNETLAPSWKSTVTYVTSALYNYKPI